MDDAKLAGLVHDAYESLSPSAEVQMRVLEALRAHEGEASGQDAPTRRAAPRVPWLVALPLAACLAVVAFLGVTTGRDATANKSDYANEFVSAEVAADVDSAVAEREVSEYRLVVLSNGRTLEVGDVVAGPVDDAAAVEAVATDADGTREIPCWVVNERYVRFEGEDAWYEVTPI